MERARMQAMNARDLKSRNSQNKYERPSILVDLHLKEQQLYYQRQNNLLDILLKGEAEETLPTVAGQNFDEQIQAARNAWPRSFHLTCGRRHRHRRYC